MATASVTNIFTNGTTAQASEVNTNFTNAINWTADGTTDFTIGSLVVNGATSLTGAVTLGDSTADDIIVTGNLASSITIKTNATYNIGAATLAPLSIYLGNGTKSTRLLAGTVGTSWTLTLPNDVPAVTGKTLISNTSGTLEFRYPDKFTAAKTTTYVLTGDETTIPCDATSGTFTVTLPAVATYAGKEFTVVKIDATAAAVVIEGDGAETINGAANYTLLIPYESVTVRCNGSAWYIISRYVPVADVELYLDDVAGHGSTNTKIMRWTNERKNTLGIYATYATNSTDGMSVTVVIPGLYAFEIANSVAGSTETYGITLNESGTLSSPTMSSLTYAQGSRIRTHSAVGSSNNMGSGTIRLAAGDVIRTRDDGAGTGAAPSAYFKMIRVAP